MSCSTESSPIFVTGFSRGGTTILMNLLASHPDVCTIGELHQVFKGSSILDSPFTILRKSLLRDLPMIVRTGQDFFSPRRWTERRSVDTLTQAFIRRVIAQSKINSGHDHLNRFKAPDVLYTSDEVQTARMLGKNLDGTVFLTDTLMAIYPDCHFCGMVRHGLAVCEGHVRRGRTARDAGIMYRRVVEKMLADAKTLPRYHIGRFEDLLANPVRELHTRLKQLELSTHIPHIRMQRRRVMNDQGEHLLSGEREWEVCWLTADELPSYLDRDVNQRQIRQLSQRDQEAFMQEAHSVMEQLGYRDDGTVEPSSFAA